MTYPDYRDLCQQFIDAVDQLTSHGNSTNGPGHRLILTVDVDNLEELAETARAELAKPEPMVPTDEELLALRSWSSHGPTFDSDLVDFARAVLARYGTTPTPIPVSEQPWEHEGFCDAEGFAWFWSPEDQCWFWERHNSNFIMRYGEEFSCLPANALPLPAAPEEGE